VQRTLPVSAMAHNRQAQHGGAWHGTIDDGVGSGVDGCGVVGRSVAWRSIDNEGVRRRRVMMEMDDR